MDYIFHIQNSSIVNFTSYEDIFDPNKDRYNRINNFSILLKDAIKGLTVKELKVLFYCHDTPKPNSITNLSSSYIAFLPVNKLHHELTTKYAFQCGSPVFHCFGNDLYEIETKKMIDAGMNKPTIYKAAFYGNLATNPIRSKCKNIAMKQPELLQVVDINKLKTDIWYNHNFMSMPKQHHLYAILIDLPGVGWSGRQQTLFFSGRPIIIVQPTYVEAWFNKMIPGFHYILAKPDLSDLIDKIKWCLDNYEAAKVIGKNGQDFAIEFLQRHHEVNRIRQAIQCIL